ncbi:hypothetical protein V5E97_34000 [Singulisphaera sp. Ch08]|uniref:Chromosome partition protein Smc n=1 Tax=Singulisphaera sp. Ch08 TaxID=3120278 RepID=A0AAU7CDT0_9BACT
MSEHVLISCNQCQRELRVRVNYLGQKVVCNHCGHLFVAEAREDFNSVSIASVGVAEQNPAESPVRTEVQEQEIQQLKEELCELKTENDRLASRFVAANYQRVSLHLRAENLESQLRQAIEHIRLVQDDLAACEVVRSEANRLRVEAFALRDAAMHAIRLEDELQRLTKQAEEQRVEYEESAALNARLQEEAETLAKEREQSYRTDTTRLRGELTGLRASLDAQRLEYEGKLARANLELDQVMIERQKASSELEVIKGERDRALSERDLAVIERDRLAGELKQLGDGLTAAHEEIHGLGETLAGVALDGVRLEEEREFVSQLRNEMHTLVKERERFLDEQLEELSEKRERLELERSAVNSRWDRDRQDGLAELQKVAGQLASIRRERDDLFQTLQQTRREFEAFKNRRLDENEAQGNRERELRSIIKRLQAARQPFDK